MNGLGLLTCNFSESKKRRRGRFYLPFVIPNNNYSSLAWLLLSSGEESTIALIFGIATIAAYKPCALRATTIEIITWPRFGCWWNQSRGEQAGGRPTAASSPDDAVMTLAAGVVVARVVCSV